VVVGAGVAGLAAACRFVDSGVEPLVLEAQDRCGGLCATLPLGPFRFDAGGHRFFTRNQAVEDFFMSLLRPDVRRVPRRSSIYFNHAFFDYPLSPRNALKGMGLWPSVQAMSSFGWHRALAAAGKIPTDTFEGWMRANFGDRLYRTFFKGYTEKVWGIPCNRISAEWASQRIREFNLAVAVKAALGLVRKRPATLADAFLYPSSGFGAFADAMARRVASAGGKVLLSTPVAEVVADSDKVLAVKTPGGDSIDADCFVFTNPLPQTASWLGAGDEARSLRFRGLISVFLALDMRSVSPNQWIYFPDEEIPFGRMHEPRNWSPDLAPEGKTSLVVEYFAFESDPIWGMADKALAADTAKRLAALGFIQDAAVIGSRVDRWPHAYPAYEMGYQDSVAAVFEKVGVYKNAILAGRTGMFRYHNADHAVETGWEAASALLGEGGNPFKVNIEPGYHEQ